MRTKSKHARYVVEYKPIEGGWWLAEVPEVPGCLTQGRSLRQTRARIREALALYVGDAAAESAELVDDITLPTTLMRQVRVAQQAREELAQAQEQAAKETARAVRTMLSKGISTRDVAELLKISHQRVSQIAAEG